MLYTGDAFPRWRGDIFAGGMALEQLARLVMDGEAVHRGGDPGVRDGPDPRRAQGPDGLIYLAIDHRDAQPTSVLRLEPAEGALSPAGGRHRAGRGPGRPRPDPCTSPAGTTA